MSIQNTSQNSVLTPVQTSVSTPIKAKDGQNWLDQWLMNYFPEAGEAEQWLSTPGARIWKIDCPWNPAHGQKASIVQLANGAISAQCFSASCHHHNWHSLRDLKEPIGRIRCAMFKNLGQTRNLYLVKVLLHSIQY
ncbi:hypothetical protein [Chromatium okenii]|uniref:hypothetical protein n=1 Tax=Chromatium okenii TaxID=61644 RepID=UPI001558FD6D|nr:hypothetical protein [Chromatium okenii]